jgi:hypothetical protein
MLCVPSISQDLEGMGLKKGIKATGSVNFSNILYATNDSVSRREPYQFFLTGNLNLNIFGYEAPFSFTYSNSRKSYTQPFNRMSITPHYKWIRAYIGHTSMTFSPYTLSGHSFRGAGLELTPGNWRMAMMYGQLKKAVKNDPLREDLVIPAYKRMGYGLKLGYEKGASGIILNLFSAKDDENSIISVPVNSTLHPMQNMAVGISGRTSLFGHLAFEAEYSVSVLNSDLRYGQASYSDTVNDPGSSLKAANVRTFDALSFGAGYQTSLGGIMFKYERVDPDYQSLGAYYFNNDLENFTFSPTIRLMDGKFSFSGNAGIQRNNLDNSRQSTTKRLVGAGNINLTLSEKLNIAMNYSNFSTFTNMKPQDDPFFRDSMDSLNFYQVTNQVGGSFNYSFGNEKAPLSIMMSASYQKADEAKSTGSTDPKSDFISANASCSKYFSETGMAISLMYNINSTNTTELRSCYSGPGINLSRAFAKKTIRASFNSTYNTGRMNNFKGSPVLSSGLNLSRTQGKDKEGKHSLMAGITWVQRFRSARQAGRNEVTGNVSYTYSF